jgi:uncharacterized protein YkwD
VHHGKDGRFRAMIAAWAWTWALAPALGGCEPLEGDSWPPAWAAFEEEVVDGVNTWRERGATCGDTVMAGGQVPLEMDDVLRQAARAMSQDMAERDFFDHVDPDGRDPEDRLQEAGFGGEYPWGENIAWGQPDPATVVQGWIDSPPHCENMLWPAFRTIGVGYYALPEEQNGHWWTQEFAGSH